MILNKEPVKYFVRPLAFILLAFLAFLLLDKLFPFRPDVAYSQIIVSEKGEILHAYLSTDHKWRMKAELEEISPVLKKVIIFKEDKYFSYHFGVNPVSVCRALFKNIVKREITSGASTITMQVARMLHPAKRNYFNKFIEMFRAMQLEWHFSKNEILTLYLNLVPYGGNIEGVKAAALLYFDEKPEAMSLAQVTALSIIPNDPKSSVPGINNSLIREKRNRWLKYFLAKKLFSEEIIKDATNESFEYYRHEAPKLIPHLSQLLKTRYPAKTTIQCFINPDMQVKTENLVYGYMQKLKNIGITNSAVIIINNVTNKVETYVGSANYFDQESFGQVDGARAIRSPGSTLKPLLFAMAVDRGQITPKTMLLDVKQNFGGYCPENYDEKCRGTISAENALALSLNIPFVKLLNETGVLNFVSGLEKTGFAKVSKNKKNLGLSMILGGCGVTLTELTNLFHVFANDGKYARAMMCTFDYKPVPVKIISAEAAYMVGEVLSQSNRPDFPTNIEASIHLPRIAWKTGTSYGRKDAWSIGFNKHYTIGVWVGNFNGFGVPELNGSDIASPLLFRIFNSVDYNSQNEWLTIPLKLNSRQVCAVTGKLPSESCTELVLDYFIPGVSSTQKCDHLKECYINPQGLFSYCRLCLPTLGYKKVLYPNLPPQLIDYYEENAIPYKKVPPHNPSCTRVFEREGPVILSPAYNTEYILLQGESNKISLKATAENDVEKLFWYINNLFLQTSIPGEAVFFTPTAEGSYKVSCTDDKGCNTNTNFTVKFL